MIIKGLICSENCEMNSIDSQQYHQNFYSMDPNFIILALYYSWIYDKDFLYWCAEFDLSGSINLFTINSISHLFCIFDDILLNSFGLSFLFIHQSGNFYADEQQWICFSFSPRLSCSIYVSIFRVISSFYLCNVALCNTP